MNNIYILNDGFLGAGYHEWFLVTGDYLFATAWFHVSYLYDGHYSLLGLHSGAEFLSFVSKILKIFFINR